MENKFDGLLSQMVQSYKGYEGFFEEIFSFLRRKTDFYQNSEQAEKICFAAADKHLKLYQKLKETEAKKKQEEKKRNEKRQESMKKASKKSKPSKPKTPQKKNLETSKKRPEENKVAKGKVLPNKGNGSKTEKYYWTQTLEEITINIPLPKNTKSKDLKVNIKTNEISITSKDEKTIFLKGKLFDKIHTDDSLWTLTNNKEIRMMEIVITKWKGAMKWWDFIVDGETPIDTQKINPEPSKLGELDGEMRGTVEKMMFDMRQKEKGLPSSDELQKQEKLQGFMKAHPEFDFSKAKFS